MTDFQIVYYSNIHFYSVGDGHEVKCFLFFAHDVEQWQDCTLNQSAVDFVII